MLGAVTGDIIGSRFEWDNIKHKRFPLFFPACRFTDDSVMTLTIAKAVLESGEDVSMLGTNAVRCMRELGRQYPNCGYGGMFRRWVWSDAPKPYNSFGNGAAMRVSACGFAAASLARAKAMAKAVTEVTHNHPEGLKGAEAVTVAIYMARTGSTMADIRALIDRKYYPMDFTLDGIRENYEFDVSCQGSVPQALMAFFASTGFEDAIRNAISIGGDSDTIAAITGGIAEAYYGVPEEIGVKAVSYLDAQLRDIVERFYSVFPQEFTVP